jgi:IclR family transcriptional regulator, acetate operon repressor
VELTCHNIKNVKQAFSSKQFDIGRTSVNAKPNMIGIAEGASGGDSGRETGTLGKAMDVLEVIAASPEPLRFTDLLPLINQPRGTLHRQLKNLIDEGLVSVGRDQTYELGLRLLRFASKSWSRNRFREIAEPVMRRLHEATGETVHLGVLSGSEVVYLDKVESRQTVRMHSQIGNASPTYCTGVGKAALSTLDDGRVRKLLANTVFRHHTPTTLLSLEALIGELHQIRTEGNAYDREEHEPGIHCVAAPVSSRDGLVAAGISVTAPAFRVSMKQLREWAPLVRDAAAALSDEVNARLSPRN